MKPRPSAWRNDTRVRIRLPQQNDETAFLAAVRASAELHASWVHPPATRDAFLLHLETVHTFTTRRFLVTSRADDTLAGVFNLTHIIRGGLQSAFLGYYAFVPHAGTGMMKEGLALVLRQAFGTMRLHRIEANIQPENEPSKRLVQSCGFTCEGFSRRYLKIAGKWRDHERWAILREDFV
ncbi:MAG: GNAT family N-acetyltransferase [Opitutaceae bacterium]